MKKTAQEIADELLASFDFTRAKQIRDIEVLSGWSTQKLTILEMEEVCRNLIIDIVEDTTHLDMICDWGFQVAKTKDQIVLQYVMLEAETQRSL
jgi:hypothetical protein